jgi:hypothetical protein
MCLIGINLYELKEDRYLLIVSIREIDSFSQEEEYRN